jgi:hypothetical protein
MSPQLPPLARAKIVEYVQEKAARLHGHNITLLRRFIARLPLELRQRIHPLSESDRQQLVGRRGAGADPHHEEDHRDRQRGRSQAA